MKEHSVQGFYSRITARIKSVSKIALLTLTLFLTIGTTAAPVFAADYNFFRDLFSDEVQIENGNSNVHTRAGIYKEGVLADSPDPADNGVKNFKAGPWLVMSPPKNLSRSGEVIDLFWHIVLNTGGTRRGNFTDSAPDKRSFAIRLGYKKADGTQVYAVNTIPSRYTPSFKDHQIKEEIMKGKELLQFIMYVDPSDADVSGWWAGIGGAIGVAGCAIGTGGIGIVGGTACAAGGGAIGHGLGAFFTSVQSWILVTHQQARTNISFAEPVPYNTPMTADFWYCAGYSENSPVGTHDDGTDAPKSLGDYVEYFTSDGKWTDTEGTHEGGYKYDVKDSQAGNLTAPCSYGAVEGASYGTVYNTAAFKIGQTLNFTSPTSLEEATDQSSQELSGGLAGTQDQRPNGALPACDILNGWRPISNANGTFMGCIAQLTYYAIYRPIAWVASLTGELFDFFLGYSLSDDSYRAAFAVTGWKLVRDISNIFFIIILIWTGLATVFNFSGVSMKKVVPALIINALLINFSLFGTQVIIDISNITARIFYNSTQVCTGKCEDTNNDGSPDNILKSKVGGHKSLSVAITSGFNPQRLFSTTAINSAQATPAKGTTGVVNQSSGASDTELAGYFIVVCLIAAAIMFGVAKMFWGTAFMFLGRVIGLYTVMIFSPFAVMTRGKMPLVSKIEDLSWDSWLKDLTSYALLAPIFVFFLYIISAFIQSGFMDAFMGDMGDNFFENVLHVAIPMLIVYFMLNQGVGIAKKYAGKIGTAIQNWTNSTAGKVVGFGAGAVVGVATGGAALVGRGAMSALGKTGLSTWAATNKDSGGMKGLLAGGTNRFMQWGQKTSFDVRNTKIGGLATTGVSTGLSKLGIKMKDTVSGNVGLGQKDYIGGNNKIKEKRQKAILDKIEARNDMTHLTEKQVTKVWEKRTEIYAEKAAEKSWEKGKLSELEAKNEKLQELKDNEAKLVAEKTAKADTATVIQKKEMDKKIEDNKNEQKAITVTLTKEMMKEKRELGDKIKNDDLYKKGFEDEEKRLKDKHGTPKNAKELSAAMRYEYSAMMLEDSLLLSGGKKRWALAPGGGGVLGGLGIFGGLGTAIGVAPGIIGGGLLVNYIDSQQESYKLAYEKTMGDYEKTMKKNKEKADAKEIRTKKIELLKNEIDEFNMFIDGHVNTIIDDAADIINKTQDQIKETKFNKARSNAQLEATLAKDDLDELRRDYKEKKKKGKATTDELEKHYEEIKKQTDDLRKKTDLANKMNTAYEKLAAKREKLETELNKDVEIQERAARDEARAKAEAKSSEDKSKGADKTP